MRWLVLPLLLVVTLSAAPPVTAEGEGWLVAARRSEGQSDLWVMPAAGGRWERLRATPHDERWPSLHPELPLVVYAARRDRNWDLYLLDLDSGEERRLTTDPHFDGWPAWSPDGRALAFASAREGDLDIHLLTLATGAVENLTANEPAHDFEPTWLDAGTILFVSTRAGSHALYRLDPEGGAAVPVAASAGARSPVGVAGERVVVIRPTPFGGTLDWLGDDVTLRAPTGPVVDTARSPDGARLVWFERRLEGDVLYVADAAGGGVTRLAGPTPGLQEIAWGTLGGVEPRREREPVAAERGGAATAQLIRLSDVETELPRLSSAVEPRFESLRAAVASELGFDFLGTVSELLRPVDFDSEESDYLSWHKAGRAIDTLLDLGWRNGRQMLEIVREDQGGDVYWRLWLRCPVQDGRCGEPLVEPPWDLSFEARWERNPGEGGGFKPFQPGYYVDFTRLAADHGWERISSYETSDFDWRSNKVALEYWHYQATDGLGWYAAMEEIYDEQTIEEWFGWNRLRTMEIPRWTLLAKEIPVPATVRHAPAAIVIP